MRGGQNMEGQDLLIAFVQGAKWWEFITHEATMWQSDQNRALEEAKQRLENGTLGKEVGK
jgi:hypothetical protein